ncbi:flavodoxin family protein [Sphingobacterium psychroaquaticum]|uniref:NAD(P)H-dependent oxidoreductase n=1 Tax=Sphingobacterium psychroaquaticum TaxID=561061 RepID=UPI00106AC39E|nr:NAD(P)H-dependent oxidoreductase [Sphingobacterium psychroaquaticum]QBQ41749.1 flavodoxin family protein [Sphingobacterium psychroaquaticum]
MKTLVLIFHPNMDQSVINKRWKQELEKFPDKYVVRDLHALYPDEKIDVRAEQQIMEEFDKIVFQFPLYWFNCPPFLKKYVDEVLTYGWAYGSKSGYKLSNKTIGFAVSVGISEAEYGPNGQYKYTIEELLRPFEVTILYIKATYGSFFAYYDIEVNSTEEWIERSIQPFTQYIDGL